MDVISNVKIATQFLGEAAAAYSTLFSRIDAKELSEEYEFLNNEVYETALQNGNLQTGMGQEIYWRENLARAHIVSVASIVRTSRWIDVATREYSAENLFGWAAACRSLMESAGDIMHSLGPVPLTLAKHKEAVLRQLSAKDDTKIVISTDLEDALIHFTHARKVRKEETAPDSHKAEPSWKYIKHLEDMSIVGANSLYSELCDIVHPAADSVRYLFESSGQKYRLSDRTESNTIQTMAQANKETLGGCLEAALNPPILTLKMLQNFHLFKKVKGLRKTGLEHHPYWRKVGEYL